MADIIERDKLCRHSDTKIQNLWEEVDWGNGSTSGIYLRAIREVLQSKSGGKMLIVGVFLLQNLFDQEFQGFMPKSWGKVWEVHICRGKFWLWWSNT